MISAIAFTLALLPTGASTGQTASLAESPIRRADRLDLGNRLMMLDRQWMRERNPQRRGTAQPIISNAVNAFFSMRFSEGCEALDLAHDSLTRRDRTTRNYSHRADALLSDTAEEPRITTYRVYENRTVPAVEKLEDRERRLADLNRQLERERTDLQRQITKVDSLYVILDRLAKSGNEDVRQWTRRLRTYTKGGSPEYTENVKSEWEALLRAERRFDSRRTEPNGATLVVALHGAGGSPGMFIKSLGAGVCVEEANRRGWIFMSPDSTAQAPKDCQDWLESRGVKVGKLIVMGHSMGGGNTIGYVGTKNRKPDAVALFAPAISRVPADLSRIPTYLAVGEQEMVQLKQAAQRLADDAKTWPQFVFEVENNCEHLMIVASKAQDAFRFFDQVVK
jgi:uncharacterized protein with GYD domain